MENKEIRIRQFSAEICDVFEELLEKYNITIPDKDRDGAEFEARLFGREYYDTEDAVTDVLVSLIDEIKKNPNKEINSEDY